MESKTDDNDDGKSEYDHKPVSTESKPSKITNKELIEKVSNYFYTDPDLLVTFESFAQKNCHIINLESEEYHLKYTELYNEYKSIFEENIEGYIHSLGSNALDLYTALQEATDEDVNSNDAIFGQILFAVSDFDIFMTMMREAAEAAAFRAKK